LKGIITVMIISIQAHYCGTNDVWPDLQNHCYYSIFINDLYIFPLIFTRYYIYCQLARCQHNIGVFDCDVIMSSPYQLLDIHVLLEMVLDFNVLLLWDIHSCKTNQKYYIAIYPWFIRYIYTVISWCLINGRKQTFYLWPWKK
jgi:hypothetical protein